MIDSQAVEELRALVEWICTFPTIEEIKNLHEIDKDVEYEQLADWLQKKEIAYGLLQVCAEITNDDLEGSEDGSVDSNTKNVEKTVVPAASEFPTEKDVWNMVCNMINLSCLAEKVEILSTLLRMAVSERCHDRGTYIGRIMQINQPDVQRVLMVIIENGMNKENAYPSPGGKSYQSYKDDLSACHLAENNDTACFSINELSDADGFENMIESKIGNVAVDEDSRSIKSNETASCISLNTPTKTSKVRSRDEAFGSDFPTLNISISPDRKRHSPDLPTQENRYQHAVNTELTEKIKLLQENNERLQEQIEKAKILEDERAEIELKRRAEDLKNENMIIKRENSLKESYETEIGDLKQKLEKEKSSSNQLKAAKEKISELQDEIDILLHCKQKLSVSEDQLNKCKERLAEFADAKDALKKEEEAHSKAVERCLKLENDLNALEPLQRQVENYRSRATEAEVKLAELEDKLQRATLQNETLAKNNKMLEEMSNFEIAEKEDLKQKLINESATDFDVANGLGEGISELNPALKEELLRLRNENKELKIYKERTSQDSVVDLEDKLKDSSTLAGTFKERYLTTKSELERTQELLHESLSREDGLKQDLIVLDKKIQELELDLHTEHERGVAAANAAEQKLQQTISSLTAKAKFEFEEMVQIKSQEIAEEKRCAKETKVELEHRITLNEQQFENDLTSLRRDYEAKIEKNNRAAESKLAEIKENWATDVKNIKANAEEERKALVNKGTDMYTKKKEIFTAKIMKYKESLETNAAEFKKYRENARAERNDLEDQAKSKILALKHRLNVSLGRQSDLEKEVEDLESNKKKLEREKMQIREENERFRRHVGSRLGSEKNWENQFDSLQREYNHLLAENRALKNRSMNSLGNIESRRDMNVSIMEDKDDSPPEITGGSVKVNNTILSNMREEYSIKFNKMNDEKRELVMRNSAAISDLQKANQRSWQLEEELSKIKTELTSTRLALQRFEHAQRMEELEHDNARSFFIKGGGENLASIAVASGAASMLSGSMKENFNPNIDQSSNEELSLSSHNTNKISHIESFMPRSNTPNSSFDKSLLMSKTKVQNKASSSKEIPSLLSNTQVGTAIDGKPECAQS